MRLLLFVAILSFGFHVCVDFMCVLLSAFCLFAYICMLVLRVLAYAFAFVCCKLAFHITRVYIACVAWFRVVGSFACACLLVFRVVVHGFAIVCCEVAFQIKRVCRLHVSVSLLSFVCLLLYACFACVRVCVCFCLLQY